MFAGKTKAAKDLLSTTQRSGALHLDDLADPTNLESPSVRDDLKSKHPEGQLRLIQNTFSLLVHWICIQLFLSHLMPTVSALLPCEPLDLQDPLASMLTIADISALLSKLHLQAHLLW